ncbi:hypothetical protein ABIE21_002724 [Conyzicola nivalis]|uniref:Secreted protein n=1 Tax=Conyzicola nivalis TaxID=1477021 RepID=A0ABV2QQ94_9MICO
MNTPSRILGVAVAASLGLALSGCALADTLQNETASSYGTKGELDEQWGKAAPWLPADSADIDVRESTRSEHAVLRASTDAALDPASCTLTERESLWTYSVDWAPRTLPDEVWACGDWAVVETDGGYFGWTPNSAGEAAATVG